MIRRYTRRASQAGAIAILDLDLDLDTKGIQTINWEQGQLSRLGWSPDGNHLVAVGIVPTGEEQETDYYIVSVKDGRVKNLGLRRMMHPRQLFMPPDWSPDGRKIAFSTRLWVSETNLIQNVSPKK